MNQRNEYLSDSVLVGGSSQDELLSTNPPPDEPNGLAVFVSGFGSGSSGELSGSGPETTDLGALAEDEFFDKQGIETRLHAYDEKAEIINEIEAFHNEDPDDPIGLTGHSRGAAAIGEIADDLNEKGIEINTFIQIDSVGVGDDEKPDNALYGTNIAVEGQAVIDGEEYVEGSQNILLDNTSHTEIDNDPRTQEIVKAEISENFARADEQLQDDYQQNDDDSWESNYVHSSDDSLNSEYGHSYSESYQDDFMSSQDPPIGVDNFDTPSTNYDNTHSMESEY
jgi:hypothetical protein